MTIATGDVLPGATFLALGAEGPQDVSLGDKMKGRKIVIFAVPGAYTGLCTTAHVPSFMRTKDAFAAKGVDESICVAVNAPPAGLINGPRRYAMPVEDGVVKVLHIEESPGTCEASAGEGLLAAI